MSLRGARNERRGNLQYLSVINKLLKIIGKKQDELEHLDYYNYENVLYSIIDEMKIDLDLLDKTVDEISLQDCSSNKEN